MKESEEKLTSAETQKERIRQRYKGINIEELDVIPAIPPENFYEDTKEKRVAVYARVSTDDPRQTSSYELQKNHYEDVVSRHEGWKLIKIYADEGISGTSLEHRDAFVKMMEDCDAGKIDLIVTKSVSRFARNVLDCIGHVRRLAARKPPIGIFFETENIYTLNSNSELSLSIISTLAQEESHNKSEIMNASIEMRFRRGIFLTPPLLGYDQDADGNLVINEEEAKTVRLIFFMYLYGYTCQQIADTLTKLGRRTKKGNYTWAASTILQTLQNERHCGDVLARKTFTPNYLNHRSVKNRQDRNQYRKKNHHEPIISRDDFIAVQRMIANAKYGNRSILPELHVITGGALRGFVSINPRWAGFSVQDYRLASASVYDEIIQIPSAPIEVKVEAQEGDLDLRGFEIARGQFFDVKNKLCVTFAKDMISFNTECIKKLKKTIYVELLINPTEHLLAVRPATPETKNKVKWAKGDSHTATPTTVSGAAFMPMIFAMFNWNTTCKYRICGIRRTKGDESVLVFDMRETEMLIPAEGLLSEAEDWENNSALSGGKPLVSTGHRVVAFPSDWVSGFGYNYYTYAQAIELESFAQSEWNVQQEGSPFQQGEQLQVSSHEEIERGISQMIAEMKTGDSDE